MNTFRREVFMAHFCESYRSIQAMVPLSSLAMAAARHDGRVRDGQASATAQRVAAIRLGFERPHAEHGDPGADDLLGRDVAGDLTFAGTSDGMVRYLRARTAFFDRGVLSAIDRGVRQIVVVA